MTETVVHPRVVLRRGPHIGEKAAYYGAPTNKGPGPVFVGTIMDIRDDGEGPTAFLATLAWPHMAQIPLDRFQEMRNGVWRTCSHSRGFDVTGSCFDCHAGVASSEDK